MEVQAARIPGPEYMLDNHHAEAIDEAIVLRDAEAPIDPRLRRGGAAHLAAIQARSSGIFDGVVLAMERVEDGVIHAVRAGYFDMIATCDSLAGDPALRALAEQLAAPDPVRNGHGRAAAIGVSAIVVRRLSSGARGFTLGRRSLDLPTDPGRWHIVPSGTVDARGLAGTLADELAEEHGLAPAPPMRVIGLGYDLVRLRPEIAAMTDDVGDIAPPPLSDEFTDLRDVPLTLEAVAGASALDLTPAARVALSAVERTLRG